MSKRANFAFALLLVAFSLVVACTASASTRHALGVPWWGDPQGCYWSPSTKCWVYSHTSDQGRTSCAVVDEYYDPGHVGPFGYKRSAAADVANIAMSEGYQWSGGCYDDSNRDPTPNVYPRETKSTLGEGPDCSGLVWRVWRESNVSYPRNNSFYFWSRSTYDHGPYSTWDFLDKTKDDGAPHVTYGKSGIIMMDAFVSTQHIGLEELSIDYGSDLIWEALGEAYGTNEFLETYRVQSKFKGVRRLAWG